MQWGFARTESAMERGTITVQVGQCGNQLGLALFDRRHSDQGTRNTYNFRTNRDGRQTARAILVDTEEKVVDQVLTSTQDHGWGFDPTNVVRQKSGAANNWAYGYACLGAQVAESCLECVRNEAEKLDYIDGFQVIMGLAGGTGSGGGTCLSEALRAEHPHSFIHHHSIGPYRGGEIVLQSYNTLLSLSSLYPVSDGIFVYANDALHGAVKELLQAQSGSTKIRKPSGGLQLDSKGKVTFDHINSMIANNIVLYESTFDSTTNVPSASADIGTHLCPVPDYKFLSLRSNPYAVDSTAMTFSATRPDMVVKNLFRMQASNRLIDAKLGSSAAHPEGNDPRTNRMVAGTISLRGSVVLEDAITNQIRHSIADLNMWPMNGSILAFPVSRYVQVNASRVSYNGWSMAGALAANDQSCQRVLLEPVLDDSWRMFERRAYIHHFERFGVTRDDFLGSFASMEQISSNYAAMSRPPS
eukprot:Clim_evm21s206 gene=Clim_evmTU21s206